MTSEIEEKIYDLVTKNENFEFAFDIHSRFESIKERLIQEFWDLLIISFKKKFPNYKFSNEENNDFNCDVSIKTIPNFTFYFLLDDNVYEYGFVFQHNGTKKQKNEAQDKFENILEECILDFDDKSSLFYENGKEEFNNLFSLKKILPENKALLIEKYINDFEKMTQSVQKLIEQND